jgi:outer membrane biogenesis lipoprotein LolB
MLNNGVKIFLALFLLLLLTGCSATGSKKNMINKKPLPIQQTQSSSGENYEIVQLSNGTYIYHDKQYPGLD